MRTLLLPAIISITAALILYSVGVWGEKLQKVLKPWHLAIFWAGFLCDTIGTTLMGFMAENQSAISLHSVTGVIAILLMLFHAIWATIVIVRKDEKMKVNFHKFSLIVWLIWLVPYLTGMFMGMKR